MTLTHSLNRNYVIVPMALANTDGTPRATNKSQLIPILEQEDVTQPNMPTSLTPTCSIIDAMALVKALGKSKGAKTFGDYNEKFAAAVKTNFQGPCTRVDVVFDCYEEHSIKMSLERDDLVKDGALGVKSAKAISSCLGNGGLSLMQMTTRLPLQIS